MLDVIRARPGRALFVLVIVQKTFAKTVGFHANDGVTTFVEIGAPAECFDRYVVFLDFARGPVEVFRANITQQLGQNGRSRQHSGRKDSLKLDSLLVKLCRGGHVPLKQKRRIWCDGKNAGISAPNPPAPRACHWE